MDWELATPDSLRGFYETSVPADFTSHVIMSLKAGVLSSPGLSPKKTRSKRGEAREARSAHRSATTEAAQGRADNALLN